MKIQIQIIATEENGEECTIDIATIERSSVSLANLGLSLNEGKNIVASIQQEVVQKQIEEHLQLRENCPHCHKKYKLKDNHRSPFRTVFGKVEFQNPRWFHCFCQPQEKKTFRPISELLPERTSPELKFLEVKWAACMPFAVATRCLHDVLPLDFKHNAETTRNHLQDVAKRKEEALGEEQVFFIDSCQAQRDKLPIPDGPFTVGIDGCYVRAREEKSDGNSRKGTTMFEVIAGKSMLSFRRGDSELKKPEMKCFASVLTYDQKPKRRLFSMLESQGMQPNQKVTFLSDGGDSVRNLQSYLSPESEHILDWFHITMRLTVLAQCARGLQPKRKDSSEDNYERIVERIKHYLWHGNVFRALQVIDSLEMDIDLLAMDASGDTKFKATRMLKYIRELFTYIDNNKSFIPNYGELYRNGETVTTAFTESAVNQIISKRLVKKQQMRWSRRGAHLLLQVRTDVLNGDLEKHFRDWYPGFRSSGLQRIDKAA